MKINSLGIIALLTLLLSSCGLADLRTAELEENGVTTGSERRGRALLKEAWRAQGLDKMVQHETYEVIAEDHWKGLLGSMGKVWPVNQTPLRLRYATGTFDGQVEILEGKEKGFRAGLQSWRYYEQVPGEPIEFQDKADKRITFGLAAYQYFFELADRLRDVPVVSYAGSTTIGGRHYDRVFATWKTPEPHQEHDQYLLYINKESKLIEYASYTIRENYLPGPKKFYGTIQFSDLREVEGVKIPFRQSVFLNAPKEKESKYLHQLTIKEFRFDSFDKDILHPDKSLEPLGDEKLTAQH